MNMDRSSLPNIIIAPLFYFTWSIITGNATWWLNNDFNTIEQKCLHIHIVFSQFNALTLKCISFPHEMNLLDRVDLFLINFCWDSIKWQSLWQMIWIGKATTVTLFCIDLKNDYNSNSRDLVLEFYHPCISFL